MKMTHQRGFAIGDWRGVKALLKLGRAAAVEGIMKRERVEMAESRWQRPFGVEVMLDWRETSNG